MNNWKEYLHNHSGIQKDAYILEHKIEKLNIWYRSFPYIAIISFVASLYFLKDFTLEKSYYSLISIGIYPYVAMILFFVLLAYIDFLKLENLNKILNFFFYCFFLSNLIIFLKYYLFVVPSSFDGGIINGEVFIPDYGSLSVVDIKNVKVGVFLLLFSSITCVGITLVEKEIDNIVKEIKSYISIHINENSKRS
jgi:hypothetical protein